MRGLRVTHPDPYVGMQQRHFRVASRGQALFPDLPDTPRGKGPGHARLTSAELLLQCDDKMSQSYKAYDRILAEIQQTEIKDVRMTGLVVSRFNAYVKRGTIRKVERPLWHQKADYPVASLTIFLPLGSRSLNKYSFRARWHYSFVLSSALQNNLPSSAICSVYCRQICYLQNF